MKRETGRKARKKPAKSAGKKATRKAGKKVARMSAPMGRPPSGSDWRPEMLSRLRGLILEAVPGVVEEVKWRKPSNSMRGVPVWSLDGIICTGETYKGAVKLTFARGAALDDPSGLFNASLEGGTRRAIDFHEGDGIDEEAFRELVRAAAAENSAAKRPGK